MANPKAHMETSESTYDATDGFTATASFLQGAASLGGAYEQYTALKAQGAFQLQMAEINQRFADMQAADVLRQGGVQGEQIQAKGRSVIGAQRAAAAAQGLDVNDANSSTSDLENDTLDAVAHDVSTAHNNAWKQAFGITTQAQNQVETAEFNKQGSDFSANQTLLTGGLKAAGSFLKSASAFSDKKGITVPSDTGLKPASMKYDTGITGPSLTGGDRSYSMKSNWWESNTKDGY